MALDHVLRENAKAFDVPSRRKVLKGPDADVASRDPGQYGAWKKHFASNLFAGGHCGERARGGNAERSHRFADQVLAKHRPEPSAPIPAP